MLSGWPQIKVFDLPFKEVLPLVTIALCSLLMPITISGITYLVLICKKRKNFENKIDHSNGIKPLNIGARIFLQGQKSNSSKENVSKVDIDSTNDQNMTITQNTEIRDQRDNSIYNQDELNISKVTSSTMKTGKRLQIDNTSCSSDENEIKKFTSSPNQKDDEYLHANDKLNCTYNRNPSLSNVLDADQISLPEAFDSTDLEFNQNDLDKTR